MLYGYTRSEDVSNLHTLSVSCLYVCDRMLGCQTARHNKGKPQYAYPY